MSELDFQYVSPMTDLSLKEPKAELIDEEKPFSSVQVLGRWLKEAVDYRHYLELPRRLGEEVATYKWAYDEGQMGNFEAKDFARESLKAGARNLSGGSLKMLGQTAKMIGKNVAEHPYLATVGSGGLNAVMPHVGENLVTLGESLIKAADEVENWDFWAPDEAVCEPEPNWSKLANVIGQSSSQVLTMGMLGKYIGSKAAYGVFAVGGAADIFEEAQAHRQTVNGATTAAMLNGSVSYALDRLLSPLPKQIEKRAKMTSRQIAGELIKAPLREGGTELLQQFGAENMVRLAGFDETQDLFEGLIENALGGIVGSVSVVGADQSLYLADKSYRKAKEKLLLSGISAEEIDGVKQNMTAFLEAHPEAFEKVLHAGLEENLAALEKTLNSQTPKVVKDFRNLYQNMYRKTYASLKDKTQAKLAASLLQANAVMLYEIDPSLTPDKLTTYPDIIKTEWEEFKQKAPQPLFQFGGKNARFADLEKLSAALELEKAEYSPEYIWRKTGWHRGDDGLMRFEISDDKARLKIWDTPLLESEAQKFYQEDLGYLETLLDECVAVLNQTPEDIKPYLTDYETYLTAYYNKQKPSDEYQAFLDNMDKARHLELTLKRDKQNIKLLQNQAQLKNGNFTFSEEDWRMLHALNERSELAKFKRAYTYPRNNFRTVYLKLADEKISENADNVSALWDLTKKIKQTEFDKRRYGKMLTAKGLQKNEVFFNEFWLKKAFELSKYPEPISDDMNYESPAYQNAYKEKTLSEEFLSKDNMPNFSREEIDRIAAFLDEEEQAFLLNRYIRKLKDNQDILSQIRYQDNYFKADLQSKYTRAEWQNFLIMHQQMKLGDILEHEALYKHYPQLAETQVRFVALDEPYHFFEDENGKFVLEVDKAQSDYADMKEIMLKGAQYVIQNIEDFDVTLTDKQMQTFMNRSLYLAKNEYSPYVQKIITRFVEQYLPKEKAVKYFAKKSMPISLVGLYQSGTETLNTEEVSYIEPNFDLLEADLNKMYGHPVSEDEKSFRHLVMMHAQELRTLYHKRIINAAREETGITLPETSWSRNSYWGAFEDRARQHRTLMTEEERRSEPYWMEHPTVESGLVAEIPETAEQTEKRRQLAETPADILQNSPDFLEEIDNSSYDDTLKELAKGAYDKATHTIGLFKNATAETIVHEMSHYFSDLLQDDKIRRNPRIREIYRYSYDKLGEEFVGRYNIERHNGKYYVTDKTDGMVIGEMLRGFETPSDALNAGIEELFVATFMERLSNNTAFEQNSDVGRLEQLFAGWLKRLILNLGIKKNQNGSGGSKIIQFLQTKLR